VNLLKKLCIKHSCAILLLAHPSMSGISTGSGLSGSTDWNNAVRSRLYLRTPPADKDGGEPDQNRLMLETRKSNYREGDTGKIEIEWRDGVFVRVQGPAGYDKLADEAEADELFLRLVERFNKEGRNISDKRGTSYAPAIFAAQPDAKGITSKQFAASMDRHFPRQETPPGQQRLPVKACLDLNRSPRRYLGRSQ
jgi:RecA-family ATPase